MASDRTKQCRRLKWLFIVLHIVLLVGPFCFFIPYAFICGNVGEQVGLTLTSLVSLVLLIFSIITDVKHRAGLHKAVLWLCVGGVILCLESIDIRVFTWVMVFASILDEVLICPLAEHYKAALLSNVEIDKRGV